mmetsp:Transcript_17128/g.33457  ORF Transcript_17128/g.33457 Transcript_17128/m.33457 type:complete len:117 (+) Transcript_17128:71-421(+)
MWHRNSWTLSSSPPLPTTFREMSTTDTEKMKKRLCKRHADCKALAKARWESVDFWNDFRGCEETCDKEKLVAMGLKPYEGKCVRFVEVSPDEVGEEENFEEEDSEDNTVISWCMPY